MQISSSSIPIDFNELNKAMDRAQNLVSQETVRRPKRLNDSMLQNDMNSSRFDADAELEDVDTENSVEMEMPTTLNIDELTVSESLFVEKINGRNIEDLVTSDSNLTLKKFIVDELVIANNSENFDAIEKKLLESDARMKRDAPNDPESEPLILNDVVVEGRINGIDFNYLVENALRTDVPNQRLEAGVRIGTLKAKSLHTNDGKVSNVDLSVFARIRGNETIIHQPIRFTESLQINHLTVLERLGEILIRDGKMDALFKRSRRQQVITGQKVFESIELLEPIILQGRINVSDPVIGRIKPIVTFNEDVIVEGDFVFYGNVTVENLLQAGNIYGQSVRYSVQQLLTDGLRLDEPTVDIPLEFGQPIHVENIEPNTSIDGIPIASLIRRNVSHVQKITARKTFTSDLNINGDCDVNEINGINLPFLNSTILRRSDKKQIVTGRIQFNRIIANK